MLQQSHGLLPELFERKLIHVLAKDEVISIQRPVGFPTSGQCAAVIYAFFAGEKLQNGVRGEIVASRGDEG